MSLCKCQICGCKVSSIDKHMFLCLANNYIAEAVDEDLERFGPGRRRNCWRITYILDETTICTARYDPIISSKNPFIVFPYEHGNPSFDVLRTPSMFSALGKVQFILELYA